MMAAPSQGPGIMGQMAATAGGVAIGSVMVNNNFEIICPTIKIYYNSIMHIVLLVNVFGNAHEALFEQIYVPKIDIIGDIN